VVACLGTIARLKRCMTGTVHDSGSVTPKCAVTLPRFQVSAGQKPCRLGPCNENPDVPPLSRSFGFCSPTFPKPTNNGKHGEERKYPGKGPAATRRLSRHASVIRGALLDSLEPIIAASVCKLQELGFWITYCNIIVVSRLIDSSIIYFSISSNHHGSYKRTFKRPYE
jgi:hypothetical protein